MEDNVLYSTLVFNKPDPAKPKEIRTTGETSSQNRPATTEEVSSPKSSSCRRATVGLGLLCILLLAGVVTVCVLNITQVSKYRTILALYINESTAHRLLQADQEVLEREKEKLTAQKDQFNSTLRFITQLSNFPVNEYCKFTNGEFHCEPCMKNWIQNGSSCYFFNIDRSWLTWLDSQQNCANMGGHLAIIDNPEEQEFISQHTPYYYDKYHGYWIGLSKQNGIWAWTTGAALESKGFWIAPQQYGFCVLSKPSHANLNNWEAKTCTMYNRWICEMKMMPWPNQM